MKYPVQTKYGSMATDEADLIKQMNDRNVGAVEVTDADGKTITATRVCSISTPDDAPVPSAAPTARKKSVDSR